MDGVLVLLLRPTPVLSRGRPPAVVGFVPMLTPPSLPPSRLFPSHRLVVRRSGSGSGSGWNLSDCPPETRLLRGGGNRRVVVSGDGRCPLLTQNQPQASPRRRRPGTDRFRVGVESQVSRERHSVHDPTPVVFTVQRLRWNG